MAFFSSWYLSARSAKATGAAITVFSAGAFLAAAAAAEADEDEAVRMAISSTCGAGGAAFPATTADEADEDEDVPLCTWAHKDL